MTFKILTIEMLTDSIQSQVENLYKQLNAENKQRPLKEIVHSKNNVQVIICVINDQIVGTALLTSYKVISGYRGMVDDVVVDASHRGKGIGRKLMERLLEEGKKIGLDEILLFTGHHRTPAIALYKSLGFSIRKSGLYNIKLN